MKHKIIIKIIAIIELLIGSTTFLSLLTYSLFSVSQKPFNIFIFVLISSLISILVGLGLINHKDWTRKVLIFFSGYIVLTKILIFLNLLQFTGEIIIFIPTGIKNSISILYHSMIIIFFNQKTVKKIFVKQ